MKSIDKREHSFKLVFQIPFHEEIDVDNLFNYYIDEHKIEKQDEREEINNAFKGVYQNLNLIDTYIEKRLNNWKISRINKENLAIIRLAVYELKFKIKDPKVILNESVELSKIYGEEGKHGFVNGILRNVLEDILYETKKR